MSVLKNTTPLSGLSKCYSLKEPSDSIPTSAQTESPYADLIRSEMLAFVPKNVQRVLDVGCHTGAFGYWIKSHYGAEVWGIEPNPITAGIAANSLDKVFNNFFSEDLFLPDRYFDLIVFNDVLEHMPDPWEAIRLAEKKLNTNGCLLVSIPNLRHIANLLHILKDQDFEYGEIGIRDKTHLRFFTKKSAQRLFVNSGLKIVHMEGINADWWTPSIIRRLAFRLFNNFLEDTKFVQFAIVAKKIE